MSNLFGNQTTIVDSLFSLERGEKVQALCKSRVRFWVKVPNKHFLVEKYILIKSFLFSCYFNVTVTSQSKRFWGDIEIQNFFIDRFGIQDVCHDMHPL